MTTITLYINDQSHALPQAAAQTISTFIDYLKTQASPALSLPQSPFSLAVNGEFVPRSDYARTALKADDRIELVIPMQGG